MKLKKRLERRAEWHFGDGAGYCQNCSLSEAGKFKKSCEDCPFEVNAPESLEGFQAWEIACRISPQIRNSFPLSEAISLAEALGYDMAVMGELLPALSTGITKALMAHKE